MIGTGCNTHATGRTGVPFGFEPVAVPPTRRLTPFVPGLPAEAGNTSVTDAVEPGARLLADMEELFTLAPNNPAAATDVADMLPLFVTDTVTT